MKLKYLLTAVAMPALLAACSQDDFENSKEIVIFLFFR